MTLLPVALFGLEVPCDGTLVSEEQSYPATFRITMAAIDPSESDESGESNSKTPSRSTLKIVREKRDPDDESGDYMRALLAENGSSEDEEDDEETNGGPSDPQKSKKARKAEALQQLVDSISAEKSDDEMEDAPSKKKADKGKSKAKDGEEDEEEDNESSDEDDDEVEEFVLCTLDPVKNYQQPLDITISENENVYFKVTGKHNVFLTGNYVITDDMEQDYNEYSDEDEDDYDLSPDEDELGSDEETSEMDDSENPRIMEVDSEEEEEIPKLTKSAVKKGKNKRPIEDPSEENTLESLISKSGKPETSSETNLSKKQLKKLKNNKGEAVGPKMEESKNETSSKHEKSDKKVQFDKKVETASNKNNEKNQTEASKPQKKASLGLKIVDGVKIDDKKLGSGRACKKGDKVFMRYIGKLSDGSVFDSNKKGTPFSFKLGTGEVIKGWDIGVTGMAPGGERRLTIPPNKAYGSKPLPGIPANSTLIFDIKLLEAK